VRIIGHRHCGCIKASSLCAPPTLARRLLFTVVIVLFGIMNLGAAVGFVLDSRQRAHFFERLQAEEVGFRTEGADGATWVWRFALDPLYAEIGAPTGTAVALTALLGLPLARLRAALPDEVRRRVRIIHAACPVCTAHHV
jgi:hypothetical protein